MGRRACDRPRPPLPRPVEIIKVEELEAKAGEVLAVEGYGPQPGHTFEVRVDSRAAVSVISEDLHDRLRREGQYIGKLKQEIVEIRGWSEEGSELRSVGELEKMEINVGNASMLELGRTIVVPRADGREVVTVGYSDCRRNGMVLDGRSGSLAWTNARGIHDMNGGITEEDWRRIEGAKDNHELNLVLAAVIPRWFPVLAKRELKGLLIPGEETGTHLGVEIPEDAVPTKDTVRYHTKGRMQRVMEVVDDWLEHGIAREVTEERYRADIWLHKLYTVRKASGKGFRGVLDMSAFGKFAKRLRGFVPATRDILEALRQGGYTILGQLDLDSAFYQLLISKEDQKFMGFRIGNRYFVLCRLAQGFANSSDIFQSRLEAALRGLEDVAIIYIDDIFLFGKDRKLYVERLYALLERLVRLRATLKLPKCLWASNELKTLGMIVTTEGMKIDPSRMEAILRLRNPMNQESLRRWIGMVDYISEFIPGYKQSVVVLTNLLKKGARVNLKEPHFDAIASVKSKLTTMKEDGGLLVNPRVDLKGVVTKSDGSKDHGGAIGGMVGQEQEGKVWPISFVGRVLRGYERSRAIPDVELMALAFVVAEARRTFGKWVELDSYVDHLGLVSLLEKPLENLTQVQSRLVLELREGGPIRLHYVKGVLNIVPDFLSRDCGPGSVVIEEIETAGKKKEKLSQDPYSEGYTRWKKKEGRWSKQEKKHWRWMDSRYSYDGHRFFLQAKKKGRKVVVPPPDERSKLIQMMHDDSDHQDGETQLYNKMRKSMYWPDMDKDLHDVVYSCVHCLRSGYLRAARPVSRKFVASRPFEKVAMDLKILRVSRRGYVALLVVVDVFTRFPEIHPVRRKTAKDIAVLLWEQWISRYGMFDLAITDEGGEFKNDLLTEVFRILQTKHHTSIPYVHRGNAIVERLNLEIWRKLRVMLVELGLNEEWDLVIPTIAGHLREAHHSVLGMSPAEALFGTDLHAIDMEQRKAALLKVRGKIAARVLAKVAGNAYVDPEPKVGDVVFMKKETANKTDIVKYDGPYAVVWRSVDTGQMGIKRITKGQSFKELKKSGGEDFVRGATQMLRSSIQYANIPESWFDVPVGLLGVDGRKRKDKTA